jgi:hypothetical protein
MQNIMKCPVYIYIYFSDWHTRECGRRGECHFITLIAWSSGCGSGVLVLDGFCDGGWDKVPADALGVWTRTRRALSVRFLGIQTQFQNHPLLTWPHHTATDWQPLRCLIFRQAKSFLWGRGHDNLLWNLAFDGAAAFPHPATSSFFSMKQILLSLYTIIMFDYRMA